MPKPLLLKLLDSWGPDWAAAEDCRGLRLFESSHPPLEIASIVN